MGKSLWEDLAKMPEEMREKYIKTIKNRAKTRFSGTKAAVYKTVEIIAPKEGLEWRGGPAWDDD